MIDIILGTVIVAFVLALFAAVMVMIIGDTETFRAIDEKIARVIICKDIDEQPTIELPHWIPCSERLPIPPTFCLVTTDGSRGDVIDIALYMSDGWHKASDVVAWMPLPEPWKGGK